VTARCSQGYTGVGWFVFFALFLSLACSDVEIALFSFCFFLSSFQR
jgi:hypothetical protein